MTITERTTLPAGEIHLWLTPLAELDDSAITEQYRALLSPSELAQQARFHFARDRHRYLVTRALIRTVLTRYTGVPAGEWTFAATAHGRPTIANAGPESRDLVFNLSHSKELVVCALRRHGALGVDTENSKRDASLETAEHFFSGPELRDLQALPAAQQQARFLELWTLKESYIKARGLGLSIPLDQFGFRFPTTGGIDPYFYNGETPDLWRFWQLRCTGDNLVALCAHNDCTLRLRSHLGAPLRDWVPVEPEVLRSSS